MPLFMATHTPGFTENMKMLYSSNIKLIHIFLLSHHTILFCLFVCFTFSFLHIIQTHEFALKQDTTPYLVLQIIQSSIKQISKNTSQELVLNLLQTSSPSNSAYCLRHESAYTKRSRTIASQPSSAIWDRRYVKDCLSLLIIITLTSVRSPAITTFV